ncbi:MAG: hypothetical protein PF689_01245, partial [Deltaproteobacteria bacterium]|nr:hypothetical protein [Deltaproteobacteria bacterium]
VIKGNCLFIHQKHKVFLVDDKLRIPLKLKKVIIKNSADEIIQEQITDNKGEIKIDTGGNLIFVYKGSEFYNSCRGEFVLPEKQGDGYLFSGLLLSLGILFLLWLNRKRFIHLFVQKNREHKKMHTRGHIAIRKKSFYNSLFSRGGKIRIKVVTLFDSKPLAGVKIHTFGTQNSHETFTDKNGELWLQSGFHLLEILKTGYAPEKVKIEPEMGFIVVKLMNFRERALFLLKKILLHYGIKNPSIHTPREALEKKIPHTQVLLLIEKIAYGKELQKSDLEKIEQVINFEKIKLKD